MSRITESPNWGLIASNAVRRSHLLKPFERWTYGRKIMLCTGLSAKVIVESEAILAHGLTQDEIDRWMEAYKNGDFEALRVGYGKKRQGGLKPDAAAAKKQVASAGRQMRKSRFNWDRP